MAKRTQTDLIVWHCSATKPGTNIGVAEIREWHLSRGWQDVGYHFVIRRNGVIELGRDLMEVGSHVAGYNARSVGCCMVGGLDVDGVAQASDPNMYTDAQWESARLLNHFLRKIFPQAKTTDHRSLSPDKNGDGKIVQSEWLKTCPGFDAAIMFSD